MEIEIMENEIKERVYFYESRYDAYMWELKSMDLHAFLVTIKENLFKELSYIDFYNCMISFFDLLFDEAMSDNRIIINKEFLINHLYYLQMILDDHNIKTRINDSLINLNIALENGEKKLTKHA